jgi:hypothetical protein
MKLALFWFELDLFPASPEATPRQVGFVLPVEVAVL